ncbi:ABC transporter substrate-binding protein [Halalkalibacter sp. APA_J-10(15)]|uniref:ABC transporter substrate-binding protein n=1 Tax=Halalkalibacter sp. APA_J-10(15) TaxID=2933805 RepID=UPI001FF40C80|nr:iron-siderophore ABC transporter substrate-binding protein [Halalkalibacter sp. APA_J-10(15)]MCK0471709.1 iron-siderophore ABC transporter substrate-binding protein [Halalkalibacter sp. APA_J-10(15)]
MSKVAFSQKGVHSSRLFVLILSFLFILAACGGEDAAQSPDEDGSDEQVEDSQDEEESQGIREVEHALGTAEIDGKPERIVTLYQGATDAAVALGITPIGAVESWDQQPFYDYFGDALNDVEVVGLETQPNLEEIAQLNPDLIIASQIRHEEVYEQLSDIAPTVVHETVFDFKGSVELLAEAAGEEEKANEILTDWNNRVADFQVKMEEKLEDEWPFSVSVLNFRADHARIYVTGFAGSILTELGFGSPEVRQDDEDILMLTDKESIPEMNADVFYIFYDHTEGAVEQSFDEWTSHPLWDNLDAVQQDQVFVVDEITWNLAGGILSANLMLDDIYERFELEQ